MNNVVPYLAAKQGQSPTATASVGSRSRQIDQPVFTEASSLNAAGYCPTRSAGAYHRIRLSVTGDWDTAQGVDVDVQQVGLR